jgi:hypothetical protein
MLNNFKKVFIIHRIHREQESTLFITPFIKPYSTSSEALLIISPWMLIFWDDACFYKQSKCYKIFISIITPSLNWTTKNGSWYWLDCRDLIDAPILLFDLREHACNLRVGFLFVPSRTLPSFTVKDWLESPCRRLIGWCCKWFSRSGIYHMMFWRSYRNSELDDDSITWPALIMLMAEEKLITSITIINLNLNLR